MQGSLRAHYIIEFIKANSLDTDLDVFDLEEHSVEEVLGTFGLYAELNSTEKDTVMRDLKEIVQQQEFAEMAYLVENQCDPLIALISNNKRERSAVKIS